MFLKYYLLFFHIILDLRFLISSCKYYLLFKERHGFHEAHMKTLQFFISAFPQN